MAVNVTGLVVGIFDPYPFILLNLMLSTLAAIQAPIIMMSQRRQEEKDRLRSENDYKVNLKAELEIRHLHETLEHHLARQWERLEAIQRLQIELLEEARAARRADAAARARICHEGRKRAAGQSPAQSWGHVRRDQSCQKGFEASISAARCESPMSRSRCGSSRERPRRVRRRSSQRTTTKPRLNSTRASGGMERFRVRAAGGVCGIARLMWHLLC